MGVSLSDLNSRGLIAQRSHFEELDDHLSQKSRVSVYTGFDPTAESLHVGGLIPLMNLRRLQKLGCRVIVLLGGATGYIGDPTGKTALRQMLDREQLAQNSAGIRQQVSKILNMDGESGIFVDNSDWFLEKKYLDFLREVGAQFSVNRMLGAECFKQRMEHGLSFLEFNYMVLQAYDFLHLYRTYDCTLQAGGDDQWSNMLAGMDLIRRNESAKAFCMTYPLLTTSDGKKMGKTEKGAVWLDPNKTTPYEYYQYWRNVEDDMVIACLNYVTEMDHEEVSRCALAKGAELNPIKEKLAFLATELLHGIDEAKKSRETAQALFAGGDQAEMPEVYLTPAEFTENGDILSVLVATKICATKSEARRLIQQGGIQLNQNKINDFKYLLHELDFINTPKEAIIQKGKKHFYRLIIKD